MAERTVEARTNSIRLPKIADVLADKLRTQILREHLEPDTPLLSEGELVETYRVSRATVREALRLLETEGLITIRRGSRGGISVARPDNSVLSRTIAMHMALDHTTVRSFMEFRKVIEPAAARLAAAQAGDLAVAQLVELAGTYGDSDAKDFHRALGDVVDNGLFRLMLTTLDAVLELHVPFEHLTSEDVSQQRRAHLKIARSIASGDGDAAAAAMLKHLEGLEKVLGRQGRLDQPLVPRATWGDSRGGDVGEPRHVVVAGEEDRVACRRRTGERRATCRPRAVHGHRPRRHWCNDCERWQSG